MITEEMLSDEVLKQAAAELAAAINDSLPSPTECQHRFSDEFERKMHNLICNLNHPICELIPTNHSK